MNARVHDIKSSVTIFLILMMIYCRVDAAQLNLEQITSFNDSELVLRKDSMSSEGTPSKGPNITMNFTVYDLGNIKPMSKSTAVFVFQNTGDDVLKITDVKKCCGAVIRLDKNEYRPGESGFLMATYQIGPRQGSFNKIISLMTNNPANPQVRLIAKGNVVETLTWTPTRLEIPLYIKDVHCPDIQIRSIDSTQFLIKDFTASGNCIKADFDPNAVSDEFILKPELDEAKAQAQALISTTGTIKIYLDHPDYKEISLSFVLIPPVQVAPQQIITFNTEPDQPIVRSLKIRNNEIDSNQPSSLEIESVTAQNGTQVKIQGQAQTQRGCEIMLEILPEKSTSTPRFTEDQIIIQLKDGTKLTVPLRLFYRTQVQSVSENNPT